MVRRKLDFSGSFHSGENVTGYSRLIIRVVRTNLTQSASIERPFEASSNEAAHKRKTKGFSKERKF